MLVIFHPKNPVQPSIFQTRQTNMWKSFIVNIVKLHQIRQHEDGKTNLIFLIYYLPPSSYYQHQVYKLRKGKDRVGREQNFKLDIVFQVF